MIKSYSKKFVKRFLNGFASAEYARSAKERFEEVCRNRGKENFPEDGVILKHHISSDFKTANLFKVKTRMTLTKDFILEELKGNNKGKTFLDVGASSTIFFKFMNIDSNEGCAVNVYPLVVEDIKKDGYQVMLVTNEILAFDDNSFDYCFSFQCMEHTPSPISHLREMLRVARSGVFVSIPYREKTVIVEKKKSSTPHDQHVYEFSPQDFEKIVAHAGGRMVRWTSFSLEKNGANNPIRYLYRRRRQYGAPSVTLAYLVSA